MGGSFHLELRHVFKCGTREIAAKLESALLDNFETKRMLETIDITPQEAIDFLRTRADF